MKSDLNQWIIKKCPVQRAKIYSVFRLGEIQKRATIKDCPYKMMYFTQKGNAIAFSLEIDFKAVTKISTSYSF